LIDGCDLVFLAKSKDDDHHQEMNSVVFLEWFESQLMPALKNPSLIVLDNASYHNVKTEDTKAIKSLPLPEGIFGASDPSFGSHIYSV
jgi:hypothetical protein